MADTLPPNSAISPQQIANARQTLAKNYQLRDLIGPGGDIDLQGLAQIHRDNPNLLTGDTRVVAQFAHDHPEVTSGISDADRAAPPGVVQDIMSVNPLKPIKSLAQLFGGWAARSAMRTPLPGAEARTPVAGLGGEFDERPINGLAPPPGAIGTPPGRQTPLPLGEGTGQVSSPPAVPPSPPQTVPPKIARDIARNAPGQPPLALVDDFAPQNGGNNADLPGVMSQGVPEGTMSKTAPRPAPQEVPAQEGGGLVFRSPNGQTIVRKRGDQLQVSASLTKQTAQGAGEGTQRMVDAFNFARANGLRLVSDTKVSNAAAKVYDRLEKMGYDITRNPTEPDGKGNLLSTSGRPAFEVSGPPLAEALGGG